MTKSKAQQAAEREEREAREAAERVATELQAAATAIAQGQAEEGYTESAWQGMSNFQCKFCAWATVGITPEAGRARITEHVTRTHGALPEFVPAMPSTPPETDRYGQLVNPPQPVPAGQTDIARA